MKGRNGILLFVPQDKDGNDGRFHEDVVEYWDIIIGIFY